MPLRPGDTVDHYELIQLIGAGGMGQVWEASEPRLGRRVALKFLPAELTRDPGRVARFEREARSASALNHPNVCHIYALGGTEDGAPFIAMELVEGETLRERLRRTSLPVPAAMAIGIQIVEAMVAAHHAGIVHRDLKPENVMLRSDGHVKVLDFGLAKPSSTAAAVEDTEPTRTVIRTEPGMIVGTVTYMSPEQARGEQVDLRTDIWSFGVLLYEMVAGRSPFSAASDTEVLAAILDRDPDPLTRFARDIPAELQRIVTKTLQKDRTHRYQATTDLLLDLQALRNGLRATPASEPQQDSRGAATSDGRASRWRTREVAIGAVGALVIGGVATAFWATRGHPSAGVPPVAAVPRTVTRVTFGDSLQTDATFAPDGRFIAYASDRAGSFDIWVQSIDGGDPVQVTKSPADEMQPDWSPDGSTIAYWSAAHGDERSGVFLAPALGGVSRRLTDSGLRPRWSPDGTTIAFLSAEPFISSGVQPEVFTIPADAKAPARRALENAQSRIPALLSAAWHPDGRISILGLKSGVPVVFTVASGGSEMVETSLEAMNIPSQAPYEATYRRATWHPDGRRLFVEVDVQRVRTVFRVEIDPVSNRVLSTERLTSGSTNDTAAALSRDGKRLAYTVQTDSDRLTLFPFEASRRRVLGEGRSIGDPSTVPATAELSRDQRRIAYLLFRPGNTRRTELWTWDIAADLGTQMTSDAFTRMAPRWSPDGRRLVYSRAEGNDQQTQIVIRDGSAERPLARPSVNFVWQWPTEDLLMGSSLSPGTQRFAIATWRVADAPDAKPRLLASSPTHNLFQSQLSPNGRFVAFVAFPTDALGLGTIYVMPVDGAQPDQWVKLSDNGISDKPRWAPDGRTVYFISNAGGSFFNLWGVPFDDDAGIPAGRPIQVTHFERPTRMLSPRLSEADISVGIDRVLLLIRESAGNVWVMDNVDK